MTSLSSLICVEQLKNNISIVLRNPAHSTFMMVLTIWALFSHDLRDCFLTKEYDYGFQLANFIAFIFFSIEILCYCFCKDEYFDLSKLNFSSTDNLKQKMMNILSVGSYIFWFDVTASIFLFFDVFIYFIIFYDTIDYNFYFRLPLLRQRFSEMEMLTQIARIPQGPQGPQD